MKTIFKNVITLVSLITFSILLFACNSRINRINIHGTYRSYDMMGYEAIVENGTIAIYNTSFFEKELYWYGTCNANEMNEENIIVSKRLETGRDNSWFGFSFGFGMNRSRVAEREILFTEDSLTFIYDMSGMAINRVTLYKDGSKERKGGAYDSNAEKADPNYVEPSKPLPHELPRGEKAPETEAPTEAPTVNAPIGDNYSL